MTDQQRDPVREAAAKCAERWLVYRNRTNIHVLTDMIHEAMRELLAAQSAEYGRSRSMDKRLAAQGKPQPAPCESQTPASEEEWQFAQKLSGEIFDYFDRNEGDIITRNEGDIITDTEDMARSVLPIIRTYVAERVKEAERLRDLFESRYLKSQENLGEMTGKTAQLACEIVELRAKLEAER